jgi:type 1 glutamine amidotransferase
MPDTLPARAHVVTGGFPVGSPAGHDHDHARLRLLEVLADRGASASVGNDFADVAKYLPAARLLITYVAGPYPNAEQCAAMRDWMTAGGHWLALHGTSGGRAERVEGMRQRRTVRTEHHDLLGCMFLTHPPACRFRVDVADTDHPATAGVAPFEVVDEPYFIELRHPAETRVLLTADYGAAAVSDSVVPMYERDTSLGPDGRTRVLGYTRAIGRGAVTYFALGHCHSPASRPGRAGDGAPDRALGAWASAGFAALLRNTIAWGLAGGR